MNKEIIGKLLTSHIKEDILIAIEHLKSYNITDIPSLSSQVIKTEIDPGYKIEYKKSIFEQDLTYYKIHDDLFVMISGNMIIFRDSYNISKSFPIINI